MLGAHGGCFRAGLGEGGGNLTADTLTGQSPENDTRRIHQGQGWKTWKVMGSDPWYMGETRVQAGP